MSPLIMIHIFTAVIGLLSGFLAMFFRKGSGWHGAAGNVFFVSMLLMSSSAAYIARFERPNALNTVVGLLTFYLVGTSWWTARHRDGKTSAFDRVALLFIVSVSVAAITFGFQAANSTRGSKDGMPAAIYFVFGSIAALCSVSDIRMLARGGLIGSQRIARHLWRMSLALLIATMSFFPGQARQLPQWLREAGWMYLPHLFVIGSMIFWMYRVKRRKGAVLKRPMPRAASAGEDTRASLGLVA